MKHWVCWISFSLAAVPVCGQAETFFLKDGSIVEGTVLRSIGKTLSIKLDSVGMQQLPVGMIDRLEIATDDGGRVSGSLAWWADGIYVLVTAQGLLEVKDGVVSNVTSEAGPLTAESQPAPAGIPADTPGDADVVDRSPDQGEAAPAPLEPDLVDGQQRKLEPTM